MQSFAASYILRMVPAIFRPLAFWFIPQCRDCYRAVRDAHAIIDPEVERRVAAVNKAQAAGEKPKKTADAIGWMYDIAKGRRIDYVSGQLSLALAAIHTTSETLGQGLFDICEYPGVIDELRKELIDVIQENGWAKTSLYKLKLMDGFLKESQRVRPMSSTAMNRFAEKKVTLSDGTVLSQGSRFHVISNFMDPTVYAEPDKFDVARFLKLRQQSGHENNWQFVTTSRDHLLFGHGQHACPGRFFASNELKIALCHLLLKYDWRFATGCSRPESQSFEGNLDLNPEGRIEFRRRKEEINLDIVE